MPIQRRSIFLAQRLFRLCVKGQVRLTLPVATGTKLLISAENSEMAGHADGNAGADGIAANATITSETSGHKFGIDVAPDFVVALKHRNERGSLSAAGLVRFFETDTQDIPKDSAIGWGVHLSGHLNLPGRDKLAGGFSIGEGIGRYLINGAFSSTDATVNTETGTITPDLSWGAYGFYTHYWSPTGAAIWSMVMKSTRMRWLAPKRYKRLMPICFSPPYRKPSWALNMCMAIARMLTAHLVKPTACSSAPGGISRAAGRARVKIAAKCDCCLSGPVIT